MEPMEPGRNHGTQEEVLGNTSTLCPILPPDAGNLCRGGLGRGGCRRTPPFSGPSWNLHCGRHEVPSTGALTRRSNSGRQQFRPLEYPAGRAETGVLLTAPARRGVTRTVPSQRDKHATLGELPGAATASVPIPLPQVPGGTQSLSYPGLPTGATAYLGDRSLNVLDAIRGEGAG